MKKIELTIPEIGLFGATRAMFGAGIALLLANKLSKKYRRAVGRALVAAGVVTMIPLVAYVFGKIMKKE